MAPFNMKFDDVVENLILKHSYNILERALKIKNANEFSSKFEACDLIISPKNLSNYSIFYLKNIDEIFQLGYKEAIEILESKKGIQFLKQENY